MSIEHYKYYRGTNAALAGGDALSHNALTRETSILPRQALRLASHCTEFDTLTQHAARRASLFSPTLLDHEHGTRLLEQAARAGVLTPQEQVRRIVANGFAPSGTRPAIQTIAIPTRDRPATLRRLLGDIARHMEVHGRTADIFVVDNSETADAQQANLAAMANISCATGIRITCVNREGRNAFAKRLSHDTGVPLEVAMFALVGAGYPTSIGACRNTALLALREQVVLFMDDDVRCRLARVPQARENVMFDAQACAGRFFATHDDMKECEFVDEDLLSVHERAITLGRVDIEHMLSAEPLLDLSGIPLAFLQQLARAPVSVRVSCLGLLGDAAMPDPLHYYLHGAATLSLLVQSESLYRAALKNRLLLRGPRGLLVTKEFAGMSYCVAVDNRTLLPPFMPVQSGEEQVFGGLVARLPGVACAMAPLAILHEPAEPRHFPEGAAERRAGRFNLNETLLAMLRAETVRGTSLDECLRSVSTRLYEIAMMPEIDLREHARSVLAPIVIGFVQRLDELLHDMPPTSTFWRDDVKRLKERCLWTLRHQDYAVPLDLEDIWGAADAPARLRQAIAQLGLLLQSWTDLASAVPRLIDGGGLSRPFATFDSACKLKGRES